MSSHHLYINISIKFPGHNSLRRRPRTMGRNDQEHVFAILLRTRRTHRHRQAVLTLDTHRRPHATHTLCNRKWERERHTEWRGAARYYQWRLYAGNYMILVLFVIIIIIGNGILFIELHCTKQSISYCKYHVLIRDYITQIKWFAIQLWILMTTLFMQQRLKFYNLLLPLLM